MDPYVTCGHGFDVLDCPTCSPPTRPTVIDHDEAHARTDEAVQRVDASHGILAARLDAAIVAVAGRLAEFTADDVWAHLGRIPDTKAAASALGPAFRRAARDGVCVRVDGAFRESARPEAHRKPLPVWRSLTVHQASLL